jgi:DNA-binding transcriptional LysR family regulator
MVQALQSWESRIGRRLKLRDLHILSVVVQWGSMAKAATQLAMTQPAVSQSITSLETTLRVRLLDRGARGVEPTLYAHALLKRGSAAFDELMQGVRDIEFLAKPNAGEIRVASGDASAAGLLAPVIDRLSRRYPEIIVRVVQTSAENLDYPELRERKVDVALARIAKSFAHDELHTEILFDDPSQVVVGALSPWARRRKVTLAELVKEPWTFTSNQTIREMISEAFKSHGLESPQEKVSASSILLRYQLIATGRYLTILPESVLRQNARQWSLKALPLDLGMKPMSVAIITLKNKTVSPLVQLFADQVRAVARTMQASSAQRQPSHPA